MIAEQPMQDRAELPAGAVADLEAARAAVDAAADRTIDFDAPDWQRQFLARKVAQLVAFEAQYEAYLAALSCPELTSPLFRGVVRDAARSLGYLVGELGHAVSKLRRELIAEEALAAVQRMSDVEVCEQATEASAALPEAVCQDFGHDHPATWQLGHSGYRRMLCVASAAASIRAGIQHRAEAVRVR